MERRNKIAATFGALALAGSIGFAAPAAHAGPPPPLTQRYILSDPNNDPTNCLDAYDSPPTGLLVGVSGACPASGGWGSSWEFDARASQYELHPWYNNGDCLTFGTGSKIGQVSIQACVLGTVPNQLFNDTVIDSNHDYVIFNPDQHFYLNDAHTANHSQHDVGVVASCSQSMPYTGCIWNQV